MASEPRESAETAAASPARAGLWHILKETYAEWREDRVPTLGAALAFYSFFSVGPLLLIAVVVAGRLYPNFNPASGSRHALRDQLAGYVGQETAATLEQLMSAANRSRAGTLATIVGIIGLLFSATGAVVALKDAMNTIWGVREPPQATWWWTIRARLSSLAVVLIVGALLILSSILSAALLSMARLASLPFSLPVAQGINMGVSFVVITLLFAAIFKLLPDVRIQWHSVLFGAAVTALLFLIGKDLFALYISYVSVGSAYGTAGSLAILLLFTYYSAQVFFLGAEFTQVWMRSVGGTPRPRRGAVLMTEPNREALAAARKFSNRGSDPDGKPGEARDAVVGCQPPSRDEHPAARHSGGVVSLAAAFLFGWLAGKRK